MKDIIIREAHDKDISKIAMLIYNTEPDPKYVWGGEAPEETLENLEELIREEDSRYSKENITVAAFNDEVLGAIVMIPYEDLDKLTIRTDFRVINWVEGLRDKLYFLMKRVNYIRFRECKKGDLYVSNIATSSRARGLGIGKALMKYAEQTAKKEEYNGVSLLAKNEQVSKFYEKLDYKKIYDKITFGERIIKMAKFV